MNHARLQNTLAALLAAVPLFAWAQTSPYAGQEARPIKALADGELRALAQGQGMGFAKAAELNGYPGPMHVVELARRLDPMPEQLAASERLMHEHKARARKPGAQGIDAERELDRLFAERSADAAAVDAATRRIGEIWKSPTCDCCKDWMAHLEANGLEIAKVHAVGNTGARGRLGIPAALGSCHTALIGGYAIEGHVPAADIQRLPKERPAGAVGLAAPGMPVGSPGMDGPADGGRQDPCDVLLVAQDGSHRVFASHR
jgi:hypothetical protein